MVGSQYSNSAGRRPPSAAGGPCSAVPTSPGLQCRLLGETALLALLTAPAAFAQIESPAKLQGSSAASDLLAKRSKQPPPTNSAPTAVEESGSQITPPTPQTAPGSTETPAPDAAGLKDAASSVSASTSKAAGQANDAVRKLQDASGSSTDKLSEQAADLTNSIDSSAGDPAAGSSMHAALHMMT